MGKILNILLAISPALEEGKQLANTNTWNNVATTTNALKIVFGFLLISVKALNIDIDLSDEQLYQLAAAVASVGGTISLYLHHATNASSGIKRKE